MLIENDVELSDEFIREEVDLVMFAVSFIDMGRM